MRNVKINGDDGHCFIIHDEDKEFASIIPQHSNIAKKDKSLVLSFDKQNAERIEISGGKGASLARLHSLSFKSELFGNSKFSVPKGIVVTTNSYNILMEDAKLKYEIDSLQKLSWSLNQNNLKSECARVSNIVANSELPNKIKHEIDIKLMSVFGNDFEQKLFAVRSSASGEDSEEMSAAGQMSTYLGVKGHNDLYQSVMKCWASQFDFVCVQYKKGYGQLINSPMAVVIQEMVNCESAGVIFTCDPITGDERKIVITANYGLGEVNKRKFIKNNY